MNLKNILWVRNTGKILPSASIQENLFGLKLSGGGGSHEKTIDFTPIITVTDAIASPVVDYQCKITAVQSGSGDPSPSNICPITGWTGAQITRAGKNYLANADIQQGSFHTSTGEDYPSTTRIRTENYIPVGNGTYTIINKQQYEYVLYVYDTDGTFLSGESKVNWQAYGTTFTMTTDRLVRIAWRKSDNTTITPSEISQLACYDGTPTVYPVSWQSEAGTVYGGVLDATTGTLTVTHFSQFYDGDRITGATKEGNLWHITTDGSLPDSEMADVAYMNFLCNYYTSRTQYDGVNNNNNSIALNYARIGQFIMRDDSLTSLEAIKTAYNATPLQIVYKLRNPQTYTLTPTEIALLAGANTLWADTGDSSMTYLAKK